MDSLIDTTGISQVSAVTAYTVLQSLTEGSIPLGSTYKSSSSWRKFIHTPSYQSFGFVVTTIPIAKTITPGPTISKPTPLPEDYDARAESFRRFIESLESEAETIDEGTAKE